MTSLLTPCHILHVCWHYKSVYFIVICHRQQSTKLSTTYANVWTCAFWRVLDILRILCELIWHNFVKVGGNWINICNLAYIGTYNRCVKIDGKFLTVCEKNEKIQITLGGIFLTHTVYVRDVISRCARYLRRCVSLPSRLGGPDSVVSSRQRCPGRSLGHKRICGIL